MRLVTFLLFAFTLFLPLAATTQSAQASTTTAAPWNRALGWASTWNCIVNSYDGREYGVDVNLPAFTPVFAPEAGTIIGYQQSNSAWQPGRLLEQLDSGPVVGFGHVNAPIVSTGSRVVAGQQITTIGDQSRFPQLGQRNHVEFMFDQNGQGGPGYYNIANFCPPDPRLPLNIYMTSAPPPPTRHVPYLGEMAFQANTGMLYTAGSAGTTNWNYGMMAGTSPSIAALPSGGYEMAFQANTGMLYTAGSAGTTNWNYGMRTGTSPSIT